MRVMIAIGLLLAAGLPARAAVVGSGDNGFSVREEAQIAAPPAKVYAAIGRIGHWWASEHTYSHDAANMALDLRAGGCLCERLPHGGAVRHMDVIFVEPGALVRLQGALGPLGGTGGMGRLTYALAPAGEGTKVVMTYDYGGYAPDGIGRWAAPVDQVLGVQLARLKRYVETGKPE